MKGFLPLLILYCFSSSLSAQAPWGTYKDTILLDGEGKKADLFDLVGIQLPQESPFINGVELEVQVPRDLIPLRGSFALVIFQGTRDPGGSTLKNSQRLGAEVIPPVAKFYIQIPLVTRSGLKSGPDKAVLEQIPKKTQGELYCTIVSMDKSVPDRVAGAEPFTLRTRSLLKNIGGLAFKFLDLEASYAPSIRIKADQQFLEGDKVNYLPPGLYELNIFGGPYRPQTLKVIVEKGKTQEVEIDLVESKAVIRMEIPSGTQVLLDGEPLTETQHNQNQILELGSHTFQFTVGDYKITRALNFKTPGNYVVSLFMEIQLRESQDLSEKP